MCPRHSCMLIKACYWPRVHKLKKDVRSLKSFILMVKTAHMNKNLQVQQEFTNQMSK